MQINGAMLIGRSEVFGTAGTLNAFNPSDGSTLQPVFGAGDRVEVNRACSLAESAFDSYRETSLGDRARFLRQIAEGLLDLGDTLIERANQETGLPKARLTAERGRTMGQLEMFAKIVEDGRWIAATIDPAIPQRKPLPRVDLLMRRIALGPVGIFGASNFPLAFSVAGGDAASALAAGCPIVVKAHPAHLGTSELVGRVIQAAVASSGFHEGVFSLVIGDGYAIGEALVRHPSIKAVGSTGSRQGGLSLMKLAAQRQEPIPVYAEMSSINPVFLLPTALAINGEGIAKGFAESLALGVGQFCTNPGVVIGIDGHEFERFGAAASTEVNMRSAGTMLSPGIHAAYERGVARLTAVAEMEPLAMGVQLEGSCLGTPALFAIDAKTVMAKPELLEEVFGPVSTLIRCATQEEMFNIATRIEGQLTASIFAQGDDLPLARQLIPILEKKVGRIVFDGFSTGVEVGWAMVHGGPFPATSDSRTTSVGASAIDRFLRPVSYQNLPVELTPIYLQDRNPAHIPQTRDTRFQQP